MTTIALTVYFEDPFWVALVEQQEQGALRAARHIFGAEPSPAEVQEFVLYQLNQLLERPFVALTVKQSAARTINPKRAARAAAKTVTAHGLSSQSQQALRIQLEQTKQVRKQQSKAEREAEANYKRQIKVEKAKARHRGR